MKIIQLTEDMDKALSHICDLALKGAGLAAHEAVQFIKGGIQALEAPAASDASVVQPSPPASDQSS